MLNLRALCLMRLSKRKRREAGVFLLGRQQDKFKKCVEMWKRGERLDKNFRRHMSICLRKK